MHRWIKLLATLLALGCAAAVHALPVLGQGTWQSTLLERDLNGDGIADAYYDTPLNITWLANANTNATVNGGQMDWATANLWATTTSFFGISGWRLPDTLPVDPSLGLGNPAQSSNNGTTDFGYGGTASEMGHLYYVTLGNTGFCTPNNAAPEGCVEQTGWGLSNTGPFAGLQSDFYWSGTAPIPVSAYYFSTFVGLQNVNPRDVQFYATAVRPGDVTGVVPEPETYALMLGGLAALAMVRRRRAA